VNQILDQLLLQRTFQQNGHLSGAGVKAADAILKKHPEHGETLCMKAREWLGPPGDLLDVAWHPFFFDMAQSIPRLTSQFPINMAILVVL
jgi:hypothetical protein